MRNWPQCPWSPLLLHYLLTFCIHLWPCEGVFYNKLTEEEKTCAWFIDVSVLCARTTKSGHLQHYCPFLGYPWRTVATGNPSSGQNFKQCTLLFILLGRKNGQRCESIVIHTLWPMVWLDGHELVSNMNGQGSLRKRYVDRLLWMSKESKYLCVLCK